MEPLIINLAPTGMLPTRALTPHVPLTPEEIVEDVLRCAALGVSMVHLHARDAAGVPTQDPGLYREIIGAIRARNPELVIVTTTSGRRVPDVESRAATLRLEGTSRPDMASLTLGSMNFATQASVNEPKTIMRLAEIMRGRGIRPELEVFDLGMVNFAWILIDKGLIEPPFYFNILLGNPSTAQATLLHVASLIADLPPRSCWSLAGLGRFQVRANALAVVMGDGVRTGLEDNLWLDEERTRLASNAQLVARVVAQAVALGRPIAAPAQVRARLGLEART